MKSVKFLAALAIPAMFAACTNEEILDDMPQNNQVMVGAEVIGTNIAINVEKSDAMSRLTATAWESGDMLGLAWQAKTVTNPTLAELTQASKIYANHMFVKPEQGSFTTKGNVYKGWHFAYWPFAYMENIVDNLPVTVNPAQTEAWTTNSGDRFDNAFYISAQHFLTKKDLDENYQLTGEKPFDMVRAVNEFVVVAQPSEAFATDQLLNNLKIKSVKLEADNEIFASYGKVLTTKLPAAQDAEGNSMYADETEYDKAKTQAAVKAALYGTNNANRAIQALKKDNKHQATITAGFDKNVYTDVLEAGLVTGNTNYLRLFTLPALDKTELTTSKTKITIEVEGGTFTIAYNKNAEEGSDEAINNKAIEAIIAAYSADGYERPDGQVVKMYELSNLPIGLNVRLIEKNFKPVFSNIISYDEWKAAVNLIDALGFTTVQTFTIKGDIEVDETTIKMPANGCPIKVSGSKNIILQKNISQWPENLNVEAIKVQVADKANFTIADGSKFNVKELEILAGGKLTMKAGKADAKNELVETITNHGTIIVNKFADIKTVTNKSRVEIKYGGVVETAAGEEGTIFYTVMAEDNVIRYNNLIEKANVNTFVVNTGKTFDYLTNASNVTSDEYGEGMGSSVAIKSGALVGIKFELNGGNIIGKQAEPVKKIEVLGGENAISNVVVTEAIDIKKGNLTINGDEVKMPTVTVNVAAGTELTSNVDIHVNTLINSGIVTGNGENYFHCNSITNNGTITNVNYCDCDSAEVTAVKSTWEALNGVLNLTTYDELITKVSTFTAADWAKTDDAGIGVKFVRALSAWLVSEGYDAIAETAPVTITKMQLKAFENATGYSFGLN